METLLEDPEMTNLLAKYIIVMQRLWTGELSLNPDQ